MRVAEAIELMTKAMLQRVVDLDQRMRLFL